MSAQTSDPPGPPAATPTDAAHSLYSGMMSGLICAMKTMAHMSQHWNTAVKAMMWGRPLLPGLPNKLMQAVATTWIRKNTRVPSQKPIDADVLRPVSAATASSCWLAATAWQPVLSGCY
eukprot:CAMPEP_0119107126 /NCGR_PEP_ID=MMETSP1180-20130426/8044_1 /TAXON_ID=3052 ORGANISM="Chlamydomonas cf sp, Strain CCMP681" /NCGR_SAMPLE_ID=MMETSP1180 /ASSEMBLY_ACC=CAM_ASM_000741 /LENGTH=118 /DNA_ID=CAMNT_0007092565 /DNA_START=392 /DNA_END=745 /DNA_ORIENTATION=+